MSATNTNTGTSAPVKGPEPAGAESAGAGLKATIWSIITQAKYKTERAVSTASAMPFEKIAYAHVPADRLGALDIDEVIDVEAHPQGAYLWVQYDPEDTRTPWRLGVYWPDERASEDPEYFPVIDKCEMMWRMLDDAEFFLNEPKPLHER